MIEKDWLAGVEKRQSRVSTLLLSVMERHLVSAYRRATAEKRGGRMTVSIDLAEAEEWFGKEPSSGESPEQIFERRWALAVLAAGLRRLQEDCQAAGRARLSPDGSALWICGFDAQLLRLPIRQKNLNPPEVGSPEKMASETGSLIADIRSDGKQLVLSNNADGRWLLFTQDQPIVSLPAEHLSSAAFSPEGRILATASYSIPGVRLWSLSEGTVQRGLPTDTPVAGLHFTPDGRWLWVVTEREIQRFDTQKWERVFAVPVADLRGLTFSPHGTMATCRDRGGIRLLRAGDLSEIARLSAPEYAGWLGNASLDFSKDASILAAHTATGTLIVWNLRELRFELRELGMDW